MNLLLRQPVMLRQGDRPPHPRWINLDNQHAKDTYTGLVIDLTCEPKWAWQQCNDHAMKVVDALNRLYSGGVHG